MPACQIQRETLPSPPPGREDFSTFERHGGRGASLLTETRGFDAGAGFDAPRRKRTVQDGFRKGRGFALTRAMIWETSAIREDGGTAPACARATRS